MTSYTASQQGCEQLPSKRAMIVSLQRIIDRLTENIDKIENQLREIQSQPPSPERDSEKTRLGDKNDAMYNKMYVKSRELSTKIDELRNLESRCIKTA